MSSVLKLKPGSGLQWLASETLVVVLGVLLALGLSDYWTARQERQLEIEYLWRIHADIQGDLQYMQDVSSVRLKMKREALDAIAPVVRGEMT